MNERLELAIHWSGFIVGFILLCFYIVNSPEYFCVFGQEWTTFSNCRRLYPWDDMQHSSYQYFPLYFIGLFVASTAIRWVMSGQVYLFPFSKKPFNKP